jgi:hypothetical protein
VISDFGSVIRGVNDRFGTGFREFHHTEENLERIFSHIEHIDKRTSGVVSEKIVSRPSQVRNKIKEEMKHRFYDGDVSGFRERAHIIYEKFTALKQ